MSKSSHTKGEWAFIEGDEYRGSFIYSDYGDGGTICVLADAWPPGSEYKEFDNSKANAHLIAASPELLEACEAQHGAIDKLLAMLVESKKGFLPTQSGVWDVVEQGYKVVNKAKGESNE